MDASILVQVQAELFLLAPRNAGADQSARKAELLRRRSDLLQMVGVEEDLPEPLQVQLLFLHFIHTSLEV